MFALRRRTPRVREAFPLLYGNVVRSLSAGPQLSIAEFLRKGPPSPQNASSPAQVKETVSGWVKSVRVHKRVSFVAISDGSTHSTLQVVLPTDAVKPLVPQGLNTGASVTCTGVRSISRDGKVDMTADDITLVGDALEFPLQKKEHTNEFLREHLSLRPRADSFGAILRMRSACASSLRSFLENEGFLWVSTPILTGNDCEGAGELFKVSTTKANENFFNADHVYLTVSGQLHSEMFVHGMRKVYTFGPTFRAENSNTTRHLAEFWMLEPEMAFTDAKETADLAERCVRKVAKDMLEKMSEDVEYLHSIEGSNRGSDEGGLLGRLKRTASTEFVKMTYFEACGILNRKSPYPVEDRAPLGSHQERFLVEQHCAGVPVIVRDYPREMKPFYALANNDTEDTSACFDLLVSGIGELIGGSAREHRYEVLEQTMQNQNLLPGLSWYLDLRKYGSTPHAGFGMGFERCVQYVTGVDNIRDVSPVPRFPGSIAL